MIPLSYLLLWNSQKNQKKKVESECKLSPGSPIEKENWRQKASSWKQSRLIHLERSFLDLSPKQQLQETTDVHMDKPRVCVFLAHSSTDDAR